MKKLLIFLLMALYCPLIAQQQEYQNLTLCDEDSLDVFTYSTNAGVQGTYFWSIDGNPSVIDGPSYDIVWGLYGEGWHTVTVNFDDGIGCPAEPVSLSVYVEICATTTMWVPNCFTPDGDEYNNVFFPVFYSGYDPYNYELLIFDRWGELIFESHKVLEGWDGTYGNKASKAQDGTYIWKITFKNPLNDKRRQVVGHVNLIR